MRGGLLKRGPRKTLHVCGVKEQFTTPLHDTVFEQALGHPCVEWEAPVEIPLSANRQPPYFRVTSSCSYLRAESPDSHSLRAAGLLIFHHLQTQLIAREEDSTLATAFLFIPKQTFLNQSMTKRLGSICFLSHISEAK